MQTDGAMTDLSAARGEIAHLQAKRDAIERAPKSDIDLRIEYEHECESIEADTWPRIRAIEGASDSAAAVGLRIMRLLIAVLGRQALIDACVADHVERLTKARREQGLPKAQRRDELAAIDRELLELGRCEELAILDLEAAGKTILRRQGVHWPTILAVWEQRFGHADEADGRAAKSAETKPASGPAE